jgi:hypothetical protein
MQWGRRNLKEDFSSGGETYYKQVTRTAQEFIGSSAFWSGLAAFLERTDDEFRLAHSNFRLLKSRAAPGLMVKPFSSSVEKAFRRNVLRNAAWPEEPDGGWVLTSNWLGTLGDIIRTQLQVQYLDGVEFLSDRLQEYAAGFDIDVTTSLQARWEGYYAAHLGFEIDVPLFDRKFRKVNQDVAVELQVTTQLKEVIFDLTHRYYEPRRLKAVQSPPEEWCWDYRAPDFTANYLGHVLHYVEGAVAKLRETTEESEVTH